MLNYDSFEEFYDPETYNLECDHFAEDFPLVELWANKLGDPLLDLACGTGRMSIHLALQGYDLTGVDIVPQMVLHGQKKARTQDVSIDWVVADARAFHLKRQFRFIFMLMNAFQFLLTRHDHEAMFACVREHLHPEGCFLFETRNPSTQNLTELRRPDGEHYTLPNGGTLDVAEEQTYDPITQIQHYKRHLVFCYANGLEVNKTNHTALRYVFPQEMEALLHYNGFEIVECYGSWQGETLIETSPAMIYVCKLRN